MIIVTKAHMFPASNSTLYYEQAQKQLDELARHKVFNVPIRLVGLFEQIYGETEAIFTEYENPRYSRTVVERKSVKCTMVPGKLSRSRAVPKLRNL